MSYKDFFINIWHFHFIQSFVSIVIKKVIQDIARSIFGILCWGIVQWLLIPPSGFLAAIRRK